mmetsp:Transcript_13951/g.50106  ORF Transcript_13951/g.50106 Transcript_13951/m.50106 type:complete len:207 (+) Transcript_13951:197-817(+)
MTASTVSLRRSADANASAAGRAIPPRGRGAAVLCFRTVPSSWVIRSRNLWRDGAPRPPPRARAPPPRLSRRDVLCETRRRARSQRLLRGALHADGLLARPRRRRRGSPPFPVSSFVFVTYHGLRVRFRRFRQIDDAISRHRRDLLCYFIASSCVSSLAASRRSRLHPQHPRHHLHLPPHRPRALALSLSPSPSLSLTPSPSLSLSS